MLETEKHRCGPHEALRQAEHNSAVCYIISDYLSGMNTTL